VASFDPSVIADIGGNQPDVAGSIAKGYTLKDLMNENQLTTLKLNSEKRAQSDQEAVRSILSQSDLTTDKGVTEASAKLTQAGQPDAAMKVRSYAQQYQSGQIEQYRQKVDLAVTSHGIIDNKIDGIWSAATAMKEEKTPDGRPKYTDAAINAFIQGQIPAAISEIQTADLPDQVKKTALGGVQPFLAKNGSQITYDQLTQLEQQSKQGMEKLKQHQQEILGQRKEATAERSEAERERHDQRTEDLMASNPNRAPPPAGTQDLLASLTEKGVTIPQGMRSRPVLNSTLSGLIRRNPGLSVDEIADKVAAGALSFAAEKKETQTAAGIAGRTSVGENELIDFAPKALAISDKVPRGNFVPYSRLKQMGEANISDPDLKELYGRTNAILNAYDVVASRGGTDKDKRAENRKNLEAADSPQAYRRAVETMIDEAKIAKRAARKAEGRDPGQDAGGGSSSQPPPQALQSLKEGVHTTFGNGQVWTLENGKPVQVQ
jgi:hypothetical protein